MRELTGGRWAGPGWLLCQVIFGGGLTCFVVGSGGWWTGASCHLATWGRLLIDRFSKVLSRTHLHRFSLYTHSKSSSYLVSFSAHLGETTSSVSARCYSPLYISSTWASTVVRSSYCLFPWHLLRLATLSGPFSTARAKKSTDPQAEEHS
jgi:hypothetical protein